MPHIADQPADISAPLLNLLAPGLGQLYQRRWGPAMHFLVDSIVLSWVFLAVPSLRIPASAVLIAIAAWSIIDAMWAGRAVGA